MNYEDLIASVQGSIKKLTDSSASASRQIKSAAKQLDAGEVKALRATLADYLRALETQKEVCDAMLATVSEFDVKEYFASGAYAEQMLEYCRQYRMDVVDEAPTYQMFPSKVTLNAEDVTLDRKKVTTARPKVLVEKIRANQIKLRKAAFNEKSFAKDLAAAYDLVLLKNPKKKKGADIPLKTIYNNMVPLARSRKEYDYQSFAFDIARLKESHYTVLEDGRMLDFGSSREAGDPVRYLDENGTEHFIYQLSIRGEASI